MSLDFKVNGYTNKLCFLFIVFSIITFLFFTTGCVTTKEYEGECKEKENKDIIKTHNIFNGVDTVEHEDFAVLDFYNLKDSITGERENISVCLKNNIPVVTASYQNTKWLDIEEILFIGTNNGRILSLKNGEKSKDAVTGALVREVYKVKLSFEEVDILYDILSNGPQVVFIGSNGRTGELKIKKRVASSMKEVLDCLVFSKD